MQSSNITEEWFSVHDNTKVRALRALLEAAKIAYKGKSFVKEFVLDDGTKQMLEFDYNTYRRLAMVWMYLMLQMMLKYYRLLKD